jgi:hypothetical protein
MAEKVQPESRVLNIRLDAQIIGRLEAITTRYGTTKTFVTKTALLRLFDEIERNPDQLDLFLR